MSCSVSADARRTQAPWSWETEIFVWQWCQVHSTYLAWSTQWAAVTSTCGASFRRVAPHTISPSWSSPHSQGSSCGSTVQPPNIFELTQELISNSLLRRPQSGKEIKCGKLQFQHLSNLCHCPGLLPTHAQFSPHFHPGMQAVIYSPSSPPESQLPPTQNSHKFPRIKWLS